MRGADQRREPVLELGVVRPGDQPAGLQHRCRSPEEFFGDLIRELHRERSDLIHGR
ncbi:hypothetical protein [Dactylosporangium cerinum]